MEIAAAVLLQSIRDLNQSCESKNTAKRNKLTQERDEAHNFWFSETGDWARSRRAWLDAAGVDREKAETAVRQRFNGGIPEHVMPTKPLNKAEQEMYDALPKGVVFSTIQGAMHANALANYAVKEALIRKGYLIQTGYRTYFSPDIRKDARLSDLLAA